MLKVKLISIVFFCAFWSFSAFAATDDGLENIKIAQYDSPSYGSGYGSQNWQSLETDYQRGKMVPDYSQYVSSANSGSQITDIHKNKFSMLAEIGSRTDKVAWDATPISDVKNGFNQSWKNKIYQGTVGANFPLLEMPMSKENGAKKIGFFLNISASQGIIRSGGHKDVTYAATDESDALPLSTSKPNSGSTSDYSISFSSKIPIINNSFFITPLFGYSVHNQNIETSSLFLYNTVPVIAGTDHSYKTTYRSKWKGSFVGLTFDIYAANRHNLALSAEYHKVTNTATWRESFVVDPNFGNLADSKSKGSGEVLTLRYKFKPHNNFYYNIAAYYKKFSTSGGRLTYHPADNSAQQTRLKKNSWSSQAVMVGVGYDF